MDEIYYFALAGRAAMDGMEEVSSFRKVRIMTNWHFILHDIVLALVYLCRHEGSLEAMPSTHATCKKKLIRPLRMLF